MKAAYLKTLTLTILLFAAFSCNNSKKNAAKNEDLKLEIPEIPAMINDEEGQLRFLSIHYWDKVDFQDTLLIKDLTKLKDFYYGYMKILSYIGDNKKIEPMMVFTDKVIEANPQVRDKFVDLLDYSLDDPNSPVRDENAYIAVVDKLINSGKLLLEQVAPLQFKYELAKKNRVGMKAADFHFFTKNGNSKSLYSISSPYTLLIFYNPDCHACQEILDRMMRSEILSKFINTGTIKVLAMYADEDVELWKKHEEEIPKTWINGYDKEMNIKNERLYDCRPSPSLYLLDKDKLVLLKDAQFEQIMAYLEAQQKNNQIN